jgi:hypothetical protein
LFLKPFVCCESLPLDAMVYLSEWAMARLLRLPPQLTVAPCSKSLKLCFETSFCGLQYWHLPAVFLIPPFETCLRANPLLTRRYSLTLSVFPQFAISTSFAGPSSV